MTDALLAQALGTLALDLLGLERAGGYNGHHEHRKQCHPDTLHVVLPCYVVSNSDGVIATVSSR